MTAQRSDSHSSSSAAPVSGTIQVSAARPTSKRPLIVLLLLLAALPWFLYGHTLNFEILLDDQPYVFDNPLLKDPQSFLYLLDFKTFARSANAWGISPDVPLNFILRPVAYLTFYINLCLSGNETASFRVVNIILHMLNGMLIFLLARRLIGRHDWRALVAAVVPAMLFVAHPLATESVTYIVQRFESLSALFCLLAMYCYLRARTATTKGYGQAWAAGSLLSTAVGMFTKETAVTVPVLILIMELAWRREPLWAAIKSLRWHFLLMPIIPIFIFATEWAQNGAFSVVDSMNITNGGPQVYPMGAYFLTQVCAWVSYLRLLILPVGQNFDHAYPLITSVADWRFLSCLTVVLALLAVTWLFFRRSKTASGAVVLLGVLWYFITLAPSSSFIPLPDLFSEHRCYLPSVGLFFVLAALLDELQSLRLTANSRFGLLAAGSIAVLAMSFATLLRNETYRSRETVWQDCLAKGTDKARIWKGLGISAYNAGRHDQAIEYFKHSTEHHPDDIESWINLCAMYVQCKRPQEGIASASAAIRIVGSKVSLLHLLAHSLVQAGRWQEGKQVWEDILKSVPEHRDSHLSLAEIFMQTGETQRALRHLQIAERSRALDPAFQQLKKQLQSQIASLP